MSTTEMWSFCSGPASSSGLLDPIGDVEWWLKPESIARGKPLVVEAPSAGAHYKDEITSQGRSQTDVFRLLFQVEEIPWP